MTAEVEERARILIVACDLVGAGLLGALVDGMGATALFPVRGESVPAALRRVVPDCVVIESIHPAVRSSETYDVASTAGIGVIVFAPSRPWGEIADIVQSHPGAELIWPRDGESLAARLEFALGAACARPRANAQE